ncbi:hypothetical protein K501DRAFT_332563 [Backusella circina FSU 941]|nr:hypothetical protein K501DRAFT_332563 [Backusella circina FSU 941]
MIEMKSKKTKNHFIEEERSTNAFTFIKNRFFMAPKTYDEKSPRASTSSSRRSSLQLSLDLLDSPDSYNEDTLFHQPNNSNNSNLFALKEGYLFKRTDFKAYKGWKLYRVVLRGHKLYLYKPMSSPLKQHQTKDYDFNREAQEVLFTTPTQGTVFMELDQNMQPTHKVQLVITEQDVTCTRLGSLKQLQWSIDSIKLDYTRLDDEEFELEEDEEREGKKEQEGKLEEDNSNTEQLSIDNGAHSDMLGSDSNGPLPFSITINDDAVFYFSTIHRELGQAWISHLQQKLNDNNNNNNNTNNNNNSNNNNTSSSIILNACSLTSSSTGSSNNNISSSFSSSNNDTDEDIGDQHDTTLTNLVQTLLFSTDNEFIHVFLSTYSLFSTAQQVLDELKRWTPKDQLYRLVGLITVWCEWYSEDIVDSVASGMIALLEEKTEEKKRKKKIDLQVMQVKELVLKTVANNNTKIESPSIIRREDDDDFGIDTTLEIENIAAKDRRRDSINMSNLLISGLTPELFLITDPTAFAEQIYVFHQAQHAKYTTQFVLAHFLPMSTLLNSTLLFTDAHPHFLTILIQNQILIESQHVEDEGVLLTRSQLLEHWICIGKELLELGDMTGWCAIALAICSPCISRLKETWKAVQRPLVACVKIEWVHILADHLKDEIKVLDVDHLKLRHYVSTTSLPYFGMLKQALYPLKNHHGKSVDFAACRSAYTIVKSQLAEYRDYDPISNWHDFPVVAPIQSFFEHAASTMTSSDLKYLHECSLVCEPKLLGQGFDGGKRVTTTTSGHSTTFQFPEILESCQLLDPLSLMLDVSQPSLDSLPEDSSTVHSSSYSSSEPQQVIKRAFHRKRSLSFASSSLPNVDSEKTLLDSLITGQSIRSLAQQSKYSNGSDVVLTVQQGELTFRATFMKTNSMKGSNDLNSSNDSPMLLVSVKAGHLESLVDLLVYGISEYTDQLKDQWNILSNNMNQLSPGDGVKMDDEDYVTVFFSSFRIFCSSHQLLEMLRKRFLSSKEQGKRAQRKNSLALLENYFQNNKPHPYQKQTCDMDWNRICQIQLRILNLLYYWLEEHYYDFMDDIEMTKLVSSFILTAKKTLESTPKLTSSLPLIQNRLQHIHQKVTIKSMTPFCESNMEYPLEISREFESIYKQMTTLHQHFNITIVRSSSPMSILHTPSENPLVLEDISSDQLLEQLDHCVRQAFCAVTLHDWIQMFDVMEAQIGDVYAWLPARKPSRTSRMSASLGLTDTQEDIVISDIYTAIEGARRSVVSPSAFSDDDLLLAFPHSIQYLYSLHYVMRYWVIQALASPKMDVKTRVLRIEKFLQVILTPQRKIPGFVEYAIASALVSPEVRLFSKAWNDVAVQHGNASLDTLQHLLAQIQKMQPILNESKAVVPSLGWILERVLELKTHQADMIHFEKRHYTVDFIHWLMGLQIELASNTPTTLSFQLMLTNEVWTWKEMRDLANKENKRNVRQRMVFHKLLLRLYVKVCSSLITYAENLSQTNRHGQQVQEAGGVYGVALDVMMQDGSVPAVVEKCICEIEKRGLEEVGIYRVAGTGSVVTSLKHAFNKGVSKVDLGDASWADINVVADAFKQFLRELPEPLLTYTYYNEFIHTSTLEDHDERVYLLKQIVKKLPLPNYTLLKRIIEHFVIVTDFESTNHMYATNLAIVFGPTLLQPSPSPSSFITTMSNLAHHQNIVKYLVLNYHYLFDVENDDVVAGPQ